MAKNPNPELPNRHALFLARSGAGKSQALKQYKEWPKRGVRSVLWDLSHDHKKGTTYYSDKLGFAKALARAVRSGRGFRIAWDGEGGSKVFEWFCSVVWAILDGRKVTYIILEELAACVDTVGKAAPHLKRLCNESRKYGGISLATTQRPQEIPKTVYDGAEMYVIGKQKGTNIKRFSEVLDVDIMEVKALQPLEFWYLDDSSTEPAIKKQLKYVA